LEDASKPKEEKQEEQSENTEETKPEDTQQEPEIQEDVDEITESEKEEKESFEETEDKVEEVSEEISDEKFEEDLSREGTDEIKESLPEEKPVKPEVKKEKPRKDREPDFKYIVRLSNTDVDGEKNVVYGLASIKGIGVHMATLIANETGIDGNMKMGDLKDPQIDKLQDAINNVNKNAPGWMLNHRKDSETGEDIHLIGSEIDMKLRDEINIMKKIRSYRGIRHERGLPVRGQRTRANNRKGLALGVSKKREQGSK
jgi:small subunit ribosomal protein S13